jgi:hypothetical protein
MPIYIRSLPMLAIPTLIYASLALPLGHDGVRATLDAVLFSVALPSGDVWSPQWGHLLMSVAWLMLFGEIVRSAQPGTSAMIENALALLLFTAQLVFFLLVPGFGTVDFTMLMGMTLLDFSAGAIVMIFASRRDVAYHAG